MAETEAAKHLAARIRLALDRHGGVILEHQHVNGVGVAWRQGILSFVVQTDSVVHVDELKTYLPSQLEGFPLAVEVESYPRAADVIPPTRAHMPSLWERLTGRRRKWLGFSHKRRVPSAS